MKKFKSKYWQVNLPDDWSSESDEESVILFRENGVGELQISTTELEEEGTDELLYSLAAEHLEAGADYDDVEFSAFKGITLDYEVDGEYCCEWYLMSGNLLVYATYACDANEEDKEEDVAELIMESLQIV